MKLKSLQDVRIKLFPFVMIAYALIVYLAVVDDLNWIFWTLLAFVILERVFVKVMMLLAKRMAERYLQNHAKALNEQLSQVAQNFPMFGPQDAGESADD